MQLEDDDTIIPIDVDNQLDDRFESSKKNAPFEPKPAATARQETARTIARSNINDSAEQLFVRSTQTHFSEEDTTWIMQEPMALDEFSLGHESAAAKLIGKAAVAVLAVTVVFFGFVAFRNGFNLSLRDLTDQVAFAFSDKTFEDIPEELKDLEIAVDEQRTVVAFDGRKIAIVTGTIRNTAPVGRSRVVLHGKLIGADGKVRSEVKAPCANNFGDVVIKSTPKGAMSKHYTKGDIPFDCKVVGESIERFQLIFDSLPEDFETAHAIEVKPFSAIYSS